MSPTIIEVQKLARTRIVEAEKAGKLHALTPKLLRRDLEKQFHLNEGELDVMKYKDAVKTSIQEAMEELNSRKGKKKDESETKKADSSSTKKRKSDVESTNQQKKPRVAEGSEDKSSTEKKVESKKSSKPKSTQRKASLSADRNIPPPDTSFYHEEDGAHKQRKPKQKSAPRIESESEGEAESKPPSKETKPSHNVPIERVTSEDMQEPTADDKSESELSVLIDEPPKRQRKSKAHKEASTTAKPGSKGKGKAKSSHTNNKDEETIKKLKSLVLACGIRKVWSKVFQGLDTPGQQIKKLKEILHELGMTGRLSMEQAKAIRAKRELEQEIQDVREFERSVVRSSRKKRNEANGSDNGRGTDGSEDEDEEDENPRPRRKAVSARQSIMAFLGDQSSDED